MSSRRNVQGSWRRGSIGAAIVLAVAASTIWFAFDRRGELTTELVAPYGTFVVQIARTPEARASGLSNRTSMEHEGLLLLWDSPGRHPIWMANMRFALDLVWLDASGRVLAVVTDVPPCDRQPCPLYEPPRTDRSTGVLEMPSGRAARFGIRVDSAIHANDARPFVR